MSTATVGTEQAKSGRIVVCGEALIDLVGNRTDQFTAHPGGSPTNVAVGLSRLEIPTTLLARLAGDSFGRTLRDHLEANDVDLTAVAAASENTTLAVATVGSDGGAQYDFYVQGTADWGWRDGELPVTLAPDAVALHVGSIALAIAPGCTRIEELMRTEHERDAVLISLDPNVRPALFGPHEAAVVRTERQVALADLVKVSAEDLEWLYPGRPTAEVAEQWLASGPGLVVVTDGSQGAIALGRSCGSLAINPIAVEVVDTVGAGDAFTAGLLSGARGHGAMTGAALAALDAAQVTSICERAVRVSALTCAQAGANPPTLAQLRAFDASR